MVYTVNGEQFTRRRKITFTNPPTINNYQCRINLDTCYTNMNSDFSDIRFTDLNGNVLYHSILEKTDGVSATVDVLIPNQESAILMYYGNPMVEDASDPENVYDFWDDFLGTTLDTTNKWSLAQGAVTVSDSNLELTSTTGTRAVLYSQPTFSPGVIQEVRYKSASSTQKNVHFNEFLNSGLTDGLIFYTYSISNFVSIKYEKSDSQYDTGDYDISSYGLSIIDYNRYAHIWTTSKCIAKVEDNTINTFTDTTYIPTTSLPVRIQEGNDGSGVAKVDWILVRKYLATEPTPVIGREEHQRRVPQFM